MRKHGNPEEPGGFTVGDMPGVWRALYEQCVADARESVDPVDDFDGFVEALWEQLAAAFALTPSDWPQDAPRPWPVDIDEQRGFAEAVLEGRVDPGQLPQ